MEVVEEHQRILMRQLMLEALEVEELIAVDLLEELVVLDRDLPEVLVAVALQPQELAEEELAEEEDLRGWTGEWRGIQVDGEFSGPLASAFYRCMIRGYLSIEIAGTDVRINSRLESQRHQARQFLVDCRQPAVAVEQGHSIRQGVQCLLYDLQLPCRSPAQPA